MAAKCQMCWVGVSARAAHALSWLSRQVSAYRLPQLCNFGGMSMNIQRKNSAHHFRMQIEREQTLVAPSTIILLMFENVVNNIMFVLFFKSWLIFSHVGRHLEFLELPKGNNSTPTWILLYTSKRCIIRRQKNFIGRNRVSQINGPMAAGLLLNFFFVTSFRWPLTFLTLVGGGIGWRGGTKMASASAPSANEPARTSF